MENLSNRPTQMLSASELHMRIEERLAQKGKTQILPKIDKLFHRLNQINLAMPLADRLKISDLNNERRKIVFAINEIGIRVCGQTMKGYSSTSALNTKVSEQTDVSEKLKFLIFKIKDRRLALPLNHLCALLQNIEIMKLPDVPEFVRGVASIQNKMIPILRIEHFLKTSSGEVENPYYLFVKNGKQIIGFEVDAVEDIEDIHHTHLLPIHGRPVIGGLIENKDGTYIQYLNPKDLFKETF